eukprot:Skav225972  [mRNA]  locus=scaffold4916:35451:37758:- [translate_table: standard]
MAQIDADREAAARYRDSDDDPAIVRAAGAGNMAAVRHFVRANSSAVHQVDQTGWTALHGAAVNGHVEVLSALAAAGADVERTSQPGWSLSSGETPLSMAKSRGKSDVAALLQAKGAGWAARIPMGAVGSSNQLALWAMQMASPFENGLLC